MKNYKLLAVAFAFLLLGQTGAVEQSNPQDDLSRRENLFEIYKKRDGGK